MISLTPVQQHNAKWKDCTACDLCHTRRAVVLWRGTVPCDALLVGEAPGETENLFAKPFCGPAGLLIDKIIANAISGLGKIDIAMTNLICCIPRDTETGGKIVEPPDESVLACRPRLGEFVRLCKPKLIVTLGNCARDWLDPKRRGAIMLPPSVWVQGAIPQVNIIHPAAILRGPIAMKSMATQRATVELRNAIIEHAAIPF